VAKVTPFDVSTSLTIPRAPSPGLNNPRYYRYYVISPVLSNGLTLLGEPNKMISVSTTRFTNLRITSTTFDVDLNVIPLTRLSYSLANLFIVFMIQGGGNESVSVSVADQSGVIYNNQCTLNAPGSGHLTCTTGSATVCRC
jgi:hypothetical protein